MEIAEVGRVIPAAQKTQSAGDAPASVALVPVVAAPQRRAPVA
jgi:hypothetical protein